MGKPSVKDRMKKLWEAVLPALSYRTKPGWHLGTDRWYLI